MKDDVEATRVASQRMPFTVRLDPELLVEALHRRKKGNPRTLADWIECGLRLAFAESGKSVSAAGVGCAAEVELFCTLAQAAPEELVGIWHWLYTRIRDKNEFWIYPGRLGSDSDDAGMEDVERYLNRRKMTALWAELSADAEQSMKAEHKERDARNGAHA
jgi:hypothetical protein